MAINYALEAKNMMRVSYKPEISFDEYVRQQGYSKEDLPRDDDIAKLLLNSQYRTTRTAGIAKNAAKRLALKKNLKDEYNNLIENGIIKKIKIETPLDPNKESDQAYIRVQIKRREAKNAK